jgi:hypothetical protein
MYRLNNDVCTTERSSDEPNVWNCGQNFRRFVDCSRFHLNVDEGYCIEAEQQWTANGCNADYATLNEPIDALTDRTPRDAEFAGDLSVRPTTVVRQRGQDLLIHGI